MIDGVKKICYSCVEVINMAKINAEKLKAMAREVKDENKSTGVKKLGDKINSGATQKKSIGDSKVSGRKG
jgi:hypothetical protein